jgi:regulation of enolase protein 1 (concanavalin A-like superfamily)
VQWHNEPASWESSPDRLVVDVEAGTDVWRDPYDGAVADDAHVRSRGVTGDFVATVRVSGDLGAPEDHAGLMARADDRTWLKCGVEYVDGFAHASAVVTRDRSDWSVVPLADAPASLWTRIARRGPSVTVSYSLDGEAYTRIRKGYLGDGDVRVGPMAAAPEGEGFRCTFDGFAVEER